ncbi:MAG: molybdopterin-dependent oxidoreductase [Chloroflexi bacterium]|nr:molybdopterin-dependent oxidoreductase [Chloroflexota bacterium]
MVAVTKGQPESQEKAIYATHCSHCGGTCLFKVYVKDGVITRLETDDGEEPQYRACARGRASRQRVYAPDRILYPLKRTGARGEGKFERISWDEALDTVAREIKRVKETYGPASIIFKRSGGDLGRLQTGHTHLRLLRMAGGCSEVWGIHSFEGAVFAQIGTFGTVDTTSTRDDLLNSKLIILWGWNPTDTVLFTNTSWYLSQAKERGAKFVSIDPRYTSTASLCDSRWLSIRPGTDTAMAIAMAYVMLKENLYDRKFIDTYTIGFDRFKDYVMGKEDGVPKTPQWAEVITGVPAAAIEGLAREYATIKPAALISGIGPGRTARGEQFHRATAVLAAMTGNIGRPGGDAGVSAFTGASGAYPYMKLGAGMPMPPNPVEAAAPPRKNAFPSWGGYTLGRIGHIHQTKVADAILKGKAGGYPADYKMLYVVNNNFPNQYFDINKHVSALKSKNLEFIVVCEQFMTPAARFADIVLPTTTSLERDDICIGPTVGFYGFMAKTIEPVGESRSHLEICVALAEKLGVPNFSEKTGDEWLKQVAAGSPDIPDYEAFKKAGGVKPRVPEPYVAFRKQIEDPQNNPFPTPSGKIEIYCQRIADMNDPLIPPIPKYIESWEGPNDPLARKYPLQLLTTHIWRRAHTQYDNIPWLRELEPQTVHINSSDAKARGIKNGDMVRVFNDRGVTIIPAKVSDRIMPGVADVPQGAWYAPDKDGVDRAGSCNVLTRDEPSPGGSYTTNTSLVQVEKA